VNSVNTYNWMKRFLAILSTSLIGLMFSTAAYAANPEPVEVKVEFVAPITISELTNLSFGLVDVNLANLDTITIAPDGAVSESTPRIVGGTQGAATFDTQAAAAKLITILIAAPTANTGYTLGTWECDYNLGVDGDCGAGLSATTVGGPNIKVRVGVTLTGNGLAGAGVFDGSFDLDITYQ
jgi:hypothetical protein